MLNLYGAFNSIISLMVHLTCFIALPFKRNLYRTYKSIIRSWFCCKKSSSSSRKASVTFEPKHNPKISNEQGGVEEDQKQKEEGRNMNGIHSFRYSEDPFIGNDRMSTSSRGLHRHASADNNCFSSTASLTRDATKRRSPTQTLSPVNLKQSKSRRMGTESHTPSWKSAKMLRTSSPLPRRSRSTIPIIFSSSSGMVKPPPIQKKLDCTLEELCYGCIKKFKITREVLTDTGGTVLEEEILQIQVEPGWKNGTTITFEGKGNERPGTYREDIIFFISEKRHDLFRREGDDLELAIEIPLVKALTGCTIPVPLLGSQEMNLTMEEIVYPGYEKIIDGQGMPITQDPRRRGYLKIKFQVIFPTQLTGDKRSEVVLLLRDSC